MRCAAAAMAAASLLLAGCSSEDGDDAGGGQRATTRTAEAPAPEPETVLRRARCPDKLSNCHAASGRILYVERVDPDGDGDAHFVLLSSQSVTAPGLSVIDVRRSLRPHPLPGPGDRISAAGPVYRGSYGQRQIEAIEVNVERRRRAAG